MARGVMAKAAQQQNPKRNKEKQERRSAKLMANAVNNSIARSSFNSMDAAHARRRGLVSGAGLAALIALFFAASQMDNARPAQQPDSDPGPPGFQEPPGGSGCADRESGCRLAASSASCIENASLRALCCESCHRLATHAGAAPKRDPLARAIPNASIQPTAATAAKVTATAAAKATSEATRGGAGSDDATAAGEGTPTADGKGFGAAKADLGGARRLWRAVRGAFRRRERGPAKQQEAAGDAGIDAGQAA